MVAQGGLERLCFRPKSFSRISFREAPPCLLLEKGQIRQGPEQPPLAGQAEGGNVILQEQRIADVVFGKDELLQYLYKGSCPRAS